MISDVINRNLRTTQERFIGFNCDKDTFTSDAIELIGVHSKRRGSLDFCLGMTLYNQLEGVKGRNELGACHYIANIIAFHGPRRLDAWDLFDDDEDLEQEIITLTIDILRRLGGLCATPNIVSYIDLYGLKNGMNRDELLKLASLLSILPDTYNYPPDLIALSLLKLEQGIIRWKVSEWIEELHRLGLALDINSEQVSGQQIETFKVQMPVVTLLDEVISLKEASLLEEGGISKVYNYNDRYAIKTVDWV